MSKTTKTDGLYVKLDDVLAILDDQYKGLCTFSCIAHDKGMEEAAERNNTAAYYTRCAAKQIERLATVDVAEVVDDVITERYEHHKERKHSASMRAHKREECGDDDLAEGLWESAHRRTIVMNELLRVQARILDRLA